MQQAKKDILTKILAVAGTVLVALPLLAPLVFALIAFTHRRRFLFDYLMPAELFGLVLAGGMLLLWGALRARMRRKLIGWSLACAVGALVLSQELAVLSGLASGAREASGWPWSLVISLLLGYIAAVVALAVGGMLLLCGLSTGRQKPPLKQ